MPPKLDLAHLRLLCALQDTQTLTAAAQVLCITPSAASHRLREAESRIGHDLVIRVAGNLRLSPAGARLERRAREILRLAEFAEAEAVEISNSKRETVVFGIAAHGPFRWLSGFVATIKKERPDIDVAIITLREDELYTALYQGRVDICLVHDGYSTRSARTTPLFGDDLVAVIAADHPLAGRSKLLPQDLVPYEFFTYSLEHISGWEHDRFFVPYGVVPIRRTEIGLIEAVIEIVRSGAGVTILGRDILAPHLAAGGLTAVQLGDGLQLTWSAMTRNGDSESGLIRQVVDRMAVETLATPPSDVTILAGPRQVQEKATAQMQTAPRQIGRRKISEPVAPA